MVTFFATLLVNILIGTIFYLIISLRLEKNTSQLQVKRMRREMDEMIHEFNITAERNITLLERKIEIFKRLLEKNGIDDSFDTAEAARHDVPLSKESHSLKAGPAVNPPHEIAPKKSDEAGLLKKIGNRLMHAIQDVPQVKEMPGRNPDATDVPAASVEAEAEKRAGSPKRKNPYKTEIEPPPGMVSADMKTAFALAGDRQEMYHLISFYYDRGISADELARVSGLPVGEISLVVSMHSRKG
jgi:HAMP domain-containing protein